MGTNIHGPVITLTPSLPAAIKGEMAEGGDNCLRGGQEGTMVGRGDGGGGGGGALSPSLPLLRHVWTWQEVCVSV